MKCEEINKPFPHQFEHLVLLSIDAVFSGSLQPVIGVI